MNNTNVYQFGNTVRLECTFYNFSGALTDPENIKVKIFDYRYNLVSEGLAIRESIGKYIFDYVTEPEEQKVFYEWYGEIAGKPSLKREEFVTKFI